MMLRSNQLDNKLEVAPDDPHLPAAQAVILEQDFHRESTDFNVGEPEDEADYGGHAESEFRDVHRGAARERKVGVSYGLD